jgi:hypothetical protein
VGSWGPTVGLVFIGPVTTRLQAAQEAGIAPLRAASHNGGMRCILAILPLLWPLAAAAEPPLLLTYEGTLAGARMIHAEARLERDETGYTLRTGVRTVGAFAVLVRGRSDVISQGVWRGNGAVPSHTDSEGVWNGQPRRLVIDYAGGVPNIRVMQPADKERRRALGRDDTAGTTDALGLMVGLIRQVGVTGRCDMAARLFDGHGVTAFTMTTGTQTAPLGTLRCEFTTRKTMAMRCLRRRCRGCRCCRCASCSLPAGPATRCWR